MPGTDTGGREVIVGIVETVAVVIDAMEATEEHRGVIVGAVAVVIGTIKAAEPGFI